MKKLLTIGLAFLCVLCLSGCGWLGSRGAERNRQRLAEIPKEGNYIFRQDNGGITNGDEYIHVETAAREAIKQEGKKIVNENSCNFSCIISDDGTFMWFLIEYSHNAEKDDYQHGEFKYAIGYTPIPNLDVKIVHYLPTRDYYFLSLKGKLGNYFLCQEEKTLFAIDLVTCEISSINMMGYTYRSALSNNELFTLGYQTNGKLLYRIFDKNLTEYDVSFEEWTGHVRIEGEYIFHYVEGNEQEQCECVRYTTGEKYDQEQSYMLYQRFCAKEETTEYPYASFEYKGKTYLWQNLQYSIEVSSKDESGNDITETQSYEKLLITDVETGEEYELIPTELAGSGGAAMAQILEIYGSCEWRQVLVQDGELFFVMVNETSFFGLPTPRTSPRIVFRYNEADGELEYVGYAVYTYYAIVQIYQGETP